jgi:hypothetical protein
MCSWGKHPISWFDALHKPEQLLTLPNTDDIIKSSFMISGEYFHHKKWHSITVHASRTKHTRGPCVQNPCCNISRRLNAMKSSRATSDVGNEFVSNVSESISASIFRHQCYAWLYCKVINHFLSFFIHTFCQKILLLVAIIATLCCHW